MPAPGTGLRFADVSDETGTRRHAVLGAPIPGTEIRISISPMPSGASWRGEIRISVPGIGAPSTACRRPAR
ncbi:hypothetical protein MAHJHV59_47990 [Mycobacterium avium subsp. hominissuis]